MALAQQHEQVRAEPLQEIVIAGVPLEPPQEPTDDRDRERLASGIAVQISPCTCSLVTSASFFLSASRPFLKASLKWST